MAHWRHGARHDYPAVDEALLAEIVARIRSVAEPERIILFGSHARGEAGPGSDLDLLVVTDSELPRHRRAAPYRPALRGLHPAKDILVWTPDEVRVWRDVPNALVTTALREGAVLYERPT